MSFWGYGMKRFANNQITLLFKKKTNIFTVLLLFGIFTHPLSAEEQKPFKSFIILPVNLQTISNGIFTFYGSAFGYHAALLPDTAFTWYSDRDGKIGYGKELVAAHLSVGIHRIELAVTSDKGEVSKDSVFIVVQDQYIDVPCELRKEIKPEFHSIGDSGVVVTALRINEDGDIAEIVFLENKTGNLQYEEYIKDYVSQLRFYPALENDQPRSMWIAQEYSFHGEKELAEVAFSVPLGLLSEEDEKFLEEFSKRRDSQDLVSSGITTSKKRIDGRRTRRRRLTESISGLPDILFASDIEISSEKTGSYDSLKACMKIDVNGLVTEIIIIENTTKEKDVEKDFVRKMANTLFVPAFSEDDAETRISYCLFTFKNGRLEELKGDNFTDWKNTYNIEFAELEEGGPPVFARARNYKTVTGMLQLLVEIDEEGETRRVDELINTLDEKDVKDKAKDAFKKNIYVPAQVKNFPKKSYLLPRFAFRNISIKHEKKLIRMYNTAFRYYIQGNYKKASKEIMELLEIDYRGYYIDIIPQLYYCIESAGEYTPAKLLMPYEQDIRKFSFFGEEQLIIDLIDEIKLLRKAIDTGQSLLDLLPKERVKLKQIFTFLSQNKLPRLSTGSDSVSKYLKYPKAARNAGLEGLVLVDALITASGTVKEAIVHQGAGFKEFDKKAIRAVRRLHFQPAQVDEDPVTFWNQIPVKFDLPGDMITYDPKPLTLDLPDSVNNPFDSISLWMGLPKTMIEGTRQFSKANDKTSGHIIAAVKISPAGYANNLVILENTINKNKKRAEEDFLKMISGSLFDMSRYKNEEQVFFCRYTVYDEYFVPEVKFSVDRWTKAGEFTFSQVSKSEQPNFKQSDKFLKADGYFRLMITVSPEGSLDKIKTIKKNINEGKMESIAKDFFENQTYTAAAVNDSLVRGYIFRTYGFNNGKEEELERVVNRYNDAFKNFTKKNFQGANDNYLEILKRDFHGKYLNMFPQYAYSGLKSQQMHHVYELVHDKLWLYASLEEYDILNELKKQFQIVQRGLLEGNDFYSALLEKDSVQTALVDVINEEYQPEPLQNLDFIVESIKYPEEAYLYDIKGIVTVAAFINKEGNVKETAIVKSVGREKCDEAVENAVKMLQFKPALINDKPLEYWVSFSVPFNPETKISAEITSK